MSDRRPQGMLTHSDRAYLLGESSPKTNAAERKKRQRIRRRIRNAILDFSVLVYLDWRDLELIFDELVTESGMIGDRALYDGLIDMIELAMRQSTLQGADFGRMMEIATLRSVGVYHLVYRGWLVDVETARETTVKPEQSIPLEEVPEAIDRFEEIPLPAALALEEFGVTTLEGVYELAEMYANEAFITDQT